MIFVACSETPSSVHLRFCSVKSPIGISAFSPVAAFVPPTPTSIAGDCHPSLSLFDSGATHRWPDEESTMHEQLKKNQPQHSSPTSLVPAAGEIGIIVVSYGNLFGKSIVCRRNEVFWALYFMFFYIQELQKEVERLAGWLAPEE
nr:hypothetical protein Iba_chr04eCG12060 [Ipomoea batatas]